MVRRRWRWGLRAPGQETGWRSTGNKGERRQRGCSPRLGDATSRTSYGRTGVRGCGPQVVAFQGETCGGAFTEADGNRWGETGDMAKSGRVQTKNRGDDRAALTFVYTSFPLSSFHYLVYM